jgi:hypothetical protein
VTVPKSAEIQVTSVIFSIELGGILNLSREELSMMQETQLDLLDPLGRMGRRIDGIRESQASCSETFTINAATSSGVQ